MPRPSPRTLVRLALARLALARLALAALLPLAGCGETDRAEIPLDPPDAALEPDAAEPDAATPDDAAQPEPDAAPDAAPDARPSSPTAGLPFVAGPDAALFDCTADFTPPDRRSPVPLGCVIDPDCHEAMVVAHRGAGGQFGTIAPENSLAAIRAALLLGVDGVELDVRHTADDRLVLMHDADLDRTTLATGAVADHTAAELAQIALRPPVRPEIPGDFGCERVATLEDAFALTRGRLFIDLDTKTSRVDLVVAAITAAGLQDEVFVSVSDAAKAAEARRLDPSIRVQVRPDSPAEYEEVMALFDRPPEIVEIPSTQIELMAPAIRAAGQKVFADVWGADVNAGLRGDVSAYRAHYAAGAHILQSEFAPLVLEALGRRE
ncbi:MAG: glycerophosphodiester phosphodiesterase family protein [Myxococcales bacterium]|nr:glycerophosphodiester phosphodiesterase family protein [Myxococcales bacterium]